MSPKRTAKVLEMADYETKSVINHIRIQTDSILRYAVSRSIAKLGTVSLASNQEHKLLYLIPMKHWF